MESDAAKNNEGNQSNDINQRKSSI